jgi:L-ascorbate metabolism protein UlaG (beta-lactamase superfamily)
MFLEIGRRFPLALAILPIAGAVLPWFRRNHMNAEDALVAFRALGAERMLPIHYETFPASFEPAGDARRRLARESARLGVQDRVTILGEGASLSLEPTGGSASGPRGTRPGARAPLPAPGRPDRRDGYAG